MHRLARADEPRANDHDLARLEAASRALLSPLAAPDADAGRREVQALPRADASLFGYPGETNVIVAEGADAASSGG